MNNNVPYSFVNASNNNFATGFNESLKINPGGNVSSKRSKKCNNCSDGNHDGNHDSLVPICPKALEGLIEETTKSSDNAITLPKPTFAQLMTKKVVLMRPTLKPVLKIKTPDSFLPKESHPRTKLNRTIKKISVFRSSPLTGDIIDSPAIVDNCTAMAEDTPKSSTILSFENSEGKYGTAKRMARKRLARKRLEFDE